MTIDIKILGAGGEYMDSATVVAWNVGPGTAVRAGDVVAVVETAKAATDVEAPANGVVTELLAGVGDEVEIGAVLGRLSAEGEAPVRPAPEETAAPTVQMADAAHHLYAVQPKRTVSSRGDRIFATPLARRIALESNVDLATVSGTGPNGRIKRRDVERALAEQAPHPATGARVTVPANEDVSGQFDADSYELRPHDGMRRTIAARLVQAKQTIPHFYLKTTCRVDELVRLRADINERAPSGTNGAPSYRISLNDFIVKAHAKALAEVPDANVTWSEAGLLIHKGVDVAIAVAVPGGLYTPVVRDADRKPVSVMSGEIKALARRAAARQLAPAEYQGGTSSVSNLGMYGVDEFAAIINPPHATILAVGAVRRVAIVEENGFSAASQITLTLSADHRAVDGALGAELLAAIKRNIEVPLGMVV